jgi:hypothetical protein
MTQGGKPRIPQAAPMEIERMSDTLNRMNLNAVS